MVNKVDVRKYTESGKTGCMKEDNRRKRSVGCETDTTDFKRVQ